MTKINKWAAAAGILSTATIFLHAIGGGPEILVPLQQAGLSEFLTTFVTLLWYGVTVTLTTGSIALFVAALRPAAAQPLILMVAAQYLALAALFIYYGLSQLGNLLEMPQWTIFLVIASVALFGLRNRHQG